MVNAMAYLRDWKIAIQWCQLYMPKQKYLVKQFIRGIPIKEFRVMLERQELKKLPDVREKFIREYKLAVKSKKNIEHVRWIE